MKHFLISFDETHGDPERTLKSVKGVSDIELISSGEFDFSKISLPGPPLSSKGLEKLAEEMDIDVNILNEPEAMVYLSHLKSKWNKPSK